MVAELVPVWDSTDVSVARGWISALVAGDAVEPMSLGGGIMPSHSPFVIPIRERCGTDVIVGAGPLDR